MKARLILIINTLFTSVLMVSCASNPPAFNQAAIATSHPLATQAGFRALDQGGNAFDAAVAAASVLSVVTPYGAGLGGGSFWLIQNKEGKAIFVDAREVAPQKSQNTSRSSNGNTPASAAIPGHPAALAHISKQYAIRPLAANLADAVHIAKRGFRVNKQYRHFATERHKTLKQQPSSSFLQQGHIPASGSIIKQPKLAATLVQLGRKGRDGFYQGEVAENIVSDLRAAGVNWTTQDLNNYKVVERPPITFRYKGSSITTAPPPAYGGIALQQTLKIIERFDTSEISHIDKIDLLSRVMSRTTPDAFTRVGDPAYGDLPIKQLTSGSYLSHLASEIDKKIPTTINLQPQNATGEHEAFMPQVSIIDKWGNKASVAMSMNMPFGSGFTSLSTGVILNNSMTNFSSNSISNNASEPGKRPLSYMSPTLIESSDSLTILGASSGKHTSTTLLLEILNDIETPIDTKQNHPFNYYFDAHTHTILIEPSALSNTEKHDLKTMGYNIKELQPTHWDLQVIHSDKTTGSIKAFSNSSGGGQAIVR